MASAYYVTQNQLVTVAHALYDYNIKVNIVVDDVAVGGHSG